MQAGAPSGLGARSFRGLTVHTMFGWSHLSTLSINMNPTKLDQRWMYVCKCQMLYHRWSRQSRCCNSRTHWWSNVRTLLQMRYRPRGLHDKIQYEPFGGKIVVFLGDPAQLKPVMCAPKWGDTSNIARGGSNRTVGLYRSTMYVKKSKHGQQLYRQHITTHWILLNRGQRNVGLLQHIRRSLQKWNVRRGVAKGPSPLVWRQKVDQALNLLMEMTLILLNL